jgi:hypothetical protein
MKGESSSQFILDIYMRRSSPLAPWAGKLVEQNVPNTLRIW